MQRWNLPEGWVMSRRPAHPALVSEADFIAAQNISAARGPAPGSSLAAPSQRRYLLAVLHLQLTAPAIPQRRRTRRGLDTRYQADPEDVIKYLRDRRIVLTRTPASGALSASGTGQATQAITLAG